MKRKCPHCNSSGGIVKAGHNASGSQRYKCKCGHTHTEKSRKKSIVHLRRLAAAMLAKAGYSLRDAARLLQISQQTVKNCAEEYAAEINVKLDDAIFDNPAFTHLADNSENYDDDF